MAETPSQLPSELLSERLEKLKAERGLGKPSADDKPQSGLGMAWAISTHLVAGIAVGVGLGLLLDNWLATSPWCLIVFLFLGAAAGGLNVYKMVAGYGMGVGFRPAENQPQQSKSEGRRG